MSLLWIPSSAVLLKAGIPSCQDGPLYPEWTQGNHSIPYHSPSLLRQVYSPLRSNGGKDCYSG